MELEAQLFLILLHRVGKNNYFSEPLVVLDAKFLEGLISSEAEALVRLSVTVFKIF